MDRDIDSILHDVRELDRESQIALAERILEESGPSDRELDAAWRSEIRSRVAAYKRGEIEVSDARDMFIRARKMIEDAKRNA
jgi:hypothetical protein